jgi:hypothetical protein
MPHILFFFDYSMKKNPFATPAANSGNANQQLVPDPFTTVSSSSVFAQQQRVNPTATVADARSQPAISKQPTTMSAASLFGPIPKTKRENDVVSKPPSTQSSSFASTAPRVVAPHNQDHIKAMDALPNPFFQGSAYQENTLNQKKQHPILASSSSSSSNQASIPGSRPAVDLASLPNPFAPPTSSIVTTTTISKKNLVSTPLAAPALPHQDDKPSVKVTEGHDPSASLKARHAVLVFSNAFTVCLLS